MFTVETRERIRERLIDMSRDDARIQSAAAVGASAIGGGDRWSDLDLTFGLVDGVPIDAVLSDWTRSLEAEFDALTLFDLPFRSSVYRVFLFPGALQVDLSFTPGAEFGAFGPRFALIFGSAAKNETMPSPSPRHLFGMGVHHAVRGRICIERGRLWQAEYWISAVRDYALSLACLRHALESGLGRGFDELPAEIRERAADALVRLVEPTELRRALREAVDNLLRESAGVHEQAEQIEIQLRELIGASPA